MIRKLSYFLILFFAVSSRAWNEENVSEELRKWLKNVVDEKVAEERKEVASSSASSSPCYSQDDVFAIYQFVEQNNQEEKSASDRLALTELDDSAGRLIFKDKKQLEAVKFHQGIAQGAGRLTFHSQRQYSTNDSYLAGNFENGCLQGVVKGFEFLPVEGIADNPGLDQPRVNSIGFYKRGFVQGPAWKVIYSPDGIVTGYFYLEDPEVPKNPNQDIDFTQKNVIFLYPDLLHGIKGQFDHKGVLIAGHQGKVTAEKSAQASGIKVIRFSVEENASLMKSDVSSKSHLSSAPLTRDPYESTMLDVKKSNIEKAGDGVFLKVAAAANTTVGYFNGVRLNKNDVFSWNPFRKSSVYLVETSDEKGNDMFLDIPPQFASWKKYQASAGHKVNHAKKANSQYTECEHPIFGKILCLYVLEDLPADTELLTSYEVALDKDGMKTVLKAALEVGHRYTGKSRKEFANSVRPYLEMASKFAEKIDVDSLLTFNFKN